MKRCAKDCSVALLSVHNRLALTRRCVEALRENAPDGGVRIVVVDDGSTDGTGEWLAAQSDIEVVKGSGDLWFGGATDAGLNYLLEARDGCDAVYLLNNDTFVRPGALETMGRLSDDPRTVVAASFWLSDRAVTGSAGFRWTKGGDLQDVILADDWRCEHDRGTGRPVAVDAVSTTLVRVPWELLRRTRLPDPKQHPHHRYDAVLSARLRRAGARFVCSTMLLADHLYGQIGDRPTVRTMTLGSFLRASFRDRRSVWYLPGCLALAWEAAPGPWRGLVSVLMRCAVFARQTTGAAAVSMGVPLRPSRPTRSQGGAGC